MISINVVELIRFYDESSPANTSQASAISGVAGEELGLALAAHSFKTSGNVASVLPEPCNPGTREGNRLDGGIYFSEGQPALFQVEVKNWPVHSKGGRALGIDAAAEELGIYRSGNWKRHWDGQPLVCFWASMHHNGHLRRFQNRETERLDLEMPKTVSRLETLDRLFERRN